MNNQSIKRLSKNPHYTMSKAEVKALQELLSDEAMKARSEEELFVEKKVNKNRVKKSTPKLKKATILREETEDDGSPE